MVWNTGGDGPGQSPWGQPGGQRPGPRPGGRPGGTGGGQNPDLDEAIARAQAWARRMLPGGGGAGSGFGGGKWGGRGVALLALAVLAVWLASGFYRVQPDQQGVVLRFGAFSRTTLPGLNYHMPWPIESVLTPAVTRVNRTEIGFRLPEGTPVVQNRFTNSGGASSRDIAEEALMLTGDENIIDINFSVFWHIRNASNYLFNTRNPRETVKSAAESVMREVIGRTPIQPALTEARARIEQQVMAGTQAILDQYGTGVEISQVQLQKVDPPDAVIDSFRDVQRANTDAERLRNEAESYRNDVVPRARGEAAQLVAEAEAVRQSLIADATGQTQRFLSVYQAYSSAKEVTLRRLYIETMQEILTNTPTVIVDDQVRGLVPFLPLNGLGDGAGRPAPARPATQAQPSTPSLPQLTQQPSRQVSPR